MNNILGRRFRRPPQHELREDKHWAYGALTLLMSARGQRPFLAYAPVQTDKTKESMTEIDKELRGILTDRPATDVELERRESQRDAAPARLPRNHGPRHELGRNLVEYDLPEDYYQTYAGKVRALTLADIGKVRPGSGSTQPSDLGVWETASRSRPAFASSAWAKSGS